MASSGIRRSPLWKIGRSARLALSLRAHQYRWFARNRNNDTYAESIFSLDKVSVGDHTYGPINVVDGYGESRLQIGSFCSIAGGVTFLLNGEHRIDTLLSFPWRTFLLSEEEKAGSRGDIVVGDDVWIGHGVLVLSGVTLGRGCVVGAGSVVTRDIPPYTVAAGVPARALRPRFTPEIREIVEQVDLGQLTREVFGELRTLLSDPLTTESGVLIRSLLEGSRSLE